MKTVSVVVPVYDNAESLPLLFDALLEVETQLAERGCALELIFVDDGSDDQSLKLLLELRQRRPALTKVIKLARNFGAIPASKAGLKFVSGDCFVWLSADLQDPPQLVVQMADRWLGGAKYVIAARATRHDPAATKFYAGVYYGLVRRLVMPDYPRGGFDTLLLDRSLMPYVRDSGRHVNPVLLSYWLGIPPAVIEYERRARRYGKSRWTFAKKLSYFLDSMLGFSALLIRLITLIGGVVALASFAYGAYRLVVAPGFPVMLAVICFLLGLIIVLLGLIGEYVWRIFDELSRRPEAVIDAVHQEDATC